MQENNTDSINGITEIHFDIEYGVFSSIYDNILKLEPRLINNREDQIDLKQSGHCAGKKKNHVWFKKKQDFHSYQTRLKRLNLK